MFEKKSKSSANFEKATKGSVQMCGRPLLILGNGILILDSEDQLFIRQNLAVIIRRATKAIKKQTSSINSC